MAAKAVTGTSHTVLAVGLEMLAVGLFTLLAGISNEAGKIVVIFMIGFWLIYLLGDSSAVASIGRAINSVTNEST